MRKLLLALALVAGLSHGDDKLNHVAVSQIIDHPALNDTYRGLEEQLIREKIKVKLDLENAQGNNAIVLQIAEKMAGQNPDVLVAIGTPAAQAALGVVNGQVPLVFAAVTDPVAAKLVDSWERTDKNVTGVVDGVPLAKNIALIKELKPDLKKVGTIYNGGEANSAAAIKELKAALAKENLELVEAAATKTAEVQEAAQALVGKVDVILLTLDNTAVSAVKTIVQTGEENKLPVFASDVGSVKNGAIAAQSFDYREVGREAGRQVAAILRGKPVAEIPVATPKEIRLVINLAAAEKMGLKLPPAVLERAQEVIK